MCQLKHHCREPSFRDSFNTDAHTQTADGRLIISDWV